MTHEDLGDARPPKKLYKVGLPIGVDDLEAYNADGPPISADGATTHCVLVNGWNTHWIVPPGEQLVRTTYENFLPVDATVHYAVVHLHNHGRWLLLRDKTTGEELWRTEVEYEKDRVQILSIPVYSSERGFRMYRDREYEVEAYYLNTSDRDVDAMALIDLYYNPDGDVSVTYPGDPA